MFYRITCIVLMVISLSSCSVFSPVSADPVKRDRDIGKTDIKIAEPERRPAKLKVTETPRALNAEHVSYIMSDIEFSEKSNGLLINIRFEGDDPKQNIHAFFSGDNFFNISFYKGRFTDEIKNRIFRSNAIRTIKFFEFKDSSQITVRLRKDYNSSIVTTDRGVISISVFN